MQIKVVVFSSALLAVAACSQPAALRTISADLPPGTHNGNAEAIAQKAISDLAASLCGKPQIVPIQSIIISMDANGVPQKYRATADVNCG